MIKFMKIKNKKVMTHNLRNSLQKFIMFEPFPKPKFLFVNIIKTSEKIYLKAMLSSFFVTFQFCTHYVAICANSKLLNELTITGITVLVSNIMTVCF